MEAYIEINGANKNKELCIEIYFAIEIFIGINEPLTW